MPWSIEAPLGPQSVGLLETSADNRLDKWIEKASALLDTPFAALGVLDGDCEILPSMHGLSEPWISERELPLSHSISKLAVDGNAPLIVADAQTDARLAGNEFLASLGAHGCLAYPVSLPDGPPFGALWVIDNHPRDWTERDMAILEMLGDALKLEVALRVETATREAARGNLKNLMQHMLIHAAVLSRNGTFMWVNEAGLPIEGLNAKELRDTHFLDAPWWTGDEETRAILAKQLEAAGNGESPRFDVRIKRPNGEGKLDLTLVPIRDGEGMTVRILMTGVDITERAAIEERQTLLMQEMAHRIRNLMSVIMSVSAQSLASADTLEEASFALRERLMAMSRCHASLLANDWNGVGLDQLISDELRAYEGRVAMEGPSVSINGTSAQTMALILHELATNAAKHGALSNDSGHVRITWGATSPGRIRLNWEEIGGPGTRPPERTGFGHSILTRVAEHEFSEAPEIRFSTGGMTYALTIPV